MVFVLDAKSTRTTLLAGALSGSRGAALDVTVPQDCDVCEVRAIGGPVAFAWGSTAPGEDALVIDPACPALLLVDRALTAMACAASSAAAQVSLSRAVKV